jgi:hypothetical protein
VTDFAGTLVNSLIVVQLLCGQRAWATKFGIPQVLEQA